MRITKLGHSCLVVEEGSVKILIDPGDYTTAQNEVRGLSAVLITQEHGDHFDVNSLKTVLANNPGALVYTNRGVGESLAREGMAFTLLEHGQRTEVAGVAVAAYGERHAPIYPSVKEIQNTGYLIGGKLFHPGDAFTVLPVQVEVLALPVSAPWLTIGQALDYAKAVKPKVCFPIHDGALKLVGAPHKLPAHELPPLGIQFLIPELGVPFEV